MKDRIHIADGHPSTSSKKRLDTYHNANGDPEALLLRIVDERDAASGGWPSIDMALDRDGARALFNWLGIWLHKEP